MAKPETSPTTGDHCSWIDSDGEADDRGCLATRHPRDPLSELARPVLCPPYSWHFFPDGSGALFAEPRSGACIPRR
jgi:hypothetical protein